MKLYYVGATWREKYAKKRTIDRAVIMAESKEEAIQKFNDSVSYPARATIVVSEYEDGVFVLGTRQVG